MMNNVWLAPMGMGVHMIFGILVLFGLACALVWIFKFATKERLFQILLWTLAIGLIGLLLTSRFGFFGQYGPGRWGMMNYYSQNPTSK